MENIKKYFKTYRIGRLYFRFIRGTPLERDGWTGYKLATWLEENGFIELIEVNGYDTENEKTKVTRYIELPGKQIGKRELLELLASENFA